MVAALTIAGSDSGGGAGIQADLKTFEAFGVFGTSVLTAVTAQNTLGVQGVHVLPPLFVQAQANAVWQDLPVRAVKTGMLASAEIIEAVAELMAQYPDIPWVIDPVMIATSGHRLLDKGAEDALRRLLHRAALATPNLPEAGVLLGAPLPADDLPAVAQQLQEVLGCAVLLKGGHAPTTEWVEDILVIHKNTPPQVFRYPRLPLGALGREAHGTGCTLSAAITAGLALGWPLAQAVATARRYVQRALQEAPEEMGRGSQPLKHSVSWQPE
ncbi:MAG: bifunctional hydroxymethylpyrimidine kinase/phosphomethylpyrimidine kinase [Bacteroidetes bacterium]|nr:bifunctional hydroxymethylpyrimidine kinase/phosphomethylpyrimidine kinase [Bacteroidota bacterium]